MSTFPASLPPSFAATREALHAVACYAVAPARKARTDHIGLRSVGDAIGTPPFDDGTRIVLRGDRLAVEPGAETAITSVRAACAFLGVAPSSDPGVGSDLPPFEPDTQLAVDPKASLALAAWYAFADSILRTIDDAGDAQLWPEHFDIAVTVELGAAGAVNVGFSPGDSYSGDPYAYVGPHDRAGLDGGYWNAPFGAVLDHGALRDASSPADRATAFIAKGLRLVRARGDQ